ncbi:MAG: hypothetical protein E7667_00495 [Ruminococcaceae bacterium]|nr:hypothetical protein [Oscillospiraceae bacterium]
MGETEALNIVKNKLGKIGIQPKDYEAVIYKKSVDARKKQDIRLVYSVAVTLEDKKLGKKLTERLGARTANFETIEYHYGDRAMTERPMVVGMGPAGMFCALILAEQGYRPIIIDRGDCVADRVRAVDKFYSHAMLDTDSNIQFGAGGAGTFSDGKLLTRINDAKCSYVLDTFFKFGAPSDILIKAKPHIGTDILRDVVDNILRRIQELGGEVIYRCRMLSFCKMSDGNIKVNTTKGDFVCGDIALALGHSARDTYKMLIDGGYAIVPKPISVGVRIEHLRQDIEQALYGDFAGHPALGAAEYALSDTKRERGVYTFCMCPGGEVVGAASEEGGVVVNGMSSYARDGRNSNSAIAVSVRPEDFEAMNGSAALGAIEFQRKIERAAFVAGGRDYSAPMQTVGDFLTKKCGSHPTKVIPTYMGGRCKIASMDDVLPEFVTEHLRYGIMSFDKKICGFADESAILTGAETRTSAPVRILRGEDMCAIGHENIYPCGEGAGYAGGITSAAVDGIKTALAIISKYKSMY